VVFAHGSGSSRHSPRNRHVASVLNQAGLGILLFDLLTPDEELDRANVFDTGMLAGRLAGATSWLRAQPGAAGLPHTCS
jgi:putative phosphoribosyl transferase